MRHIGRYIVRGLLGRGGMGKVYKVELPAIQKIAALKLLDPDPLLEKLLGRKKLQDQFISEARTLAGLKHPHIVEIHDFDRWEGKPFYIMDYYAHNLGTMIGESYQTEKPSRTIPIDRALGYCRQILEGLACLHDAGIIHRDIKPFNLLLTMNDGLKICDFGLSKLRGEHHQGPPNINVGSPYYVAPEQEKNPNEVSPSADLFPVGVMLYRMLTGLLPEVQPVIQTYKAASSCNPDLDEAWDTFIGRAMAYAPNARFASAKEMMMALEILEKHWKAQKKRICEIPQEVIGSWPAKNPKPPLRTMPVKMTPEDAIQRLGLNELWRPLIYYDNHFDLKDQIVIDQTTNLIWQQAGSDYPCAWPQAEAYVSHLNEIHFGGKNTWRLPTLDELITLLKPVSRARDWCLPPLFNTLQQRLWSIDRRSFIAAYYVDAEMGFAGWQDFSAPHYVRAVCSA